MTKQPHHPQQQPADNINNAEREARFQAHIDSENSIEPDHWMPEEYRQTLIRMVGQHAHSEIMAMMLERNWITRAPSLHRKAILLAKIQDEIGHGLYLFSACETFGISREALLEKLFTGEQKYANTFNYPTLNWGDIGVLGWLADGAAITMQIPLCRASFGPYSRAALRICQEETFHMRQGFEATHALVKGNAAQKRMAQDALNRWWQPILMMFGFSDKMSDSTQSTLWKIKRYSNDYLRQKYVDMAVPQADFLGLEIPDDKLKWNEAKQHYDFTPPDMDEMLHGLMGNGKTSRERMHTRKQAWQDGAWVREAARAYGEKQKTARLAAE